MAGIPPPPSYPPPAYVPPPPPPLTPPPPPSGMRAAVIALVVLTTLTVILSVTIGIVLLVRDTGSGPDPDPTPGPSSSLTEPVSQDEQVIAGAEAIARGAEAYAGYYGYGPAIDDALPGGLLAQFVDPWPTNPYTGSPMTQGSAPGDYTFSTAISMGDGQEYLGYVTAILSTGETYAVEFSY